MNGRMIIGCKDCGVLGVMIVGRVCRIGAGGNGIVCGMRVE